MADQIDKHLHLIETYGDAIFSTCMRVLQHRQDAEDASQEALLKILRAQTDDIQNVRAWVHTVAANTAKEWIRKQQRLRERHRQAGAMVNENEEHEPDAAESLAALDEALLNMDPESAELLRRHYLDGISQSDLAREQNISQPALRKRLLIALEQLRRQFKRLGLAIALTSLIGLLEASEKIQYAAPETFRALALAEAGRQAATPLALSASSWLTFAGITAAASVISLIAWWSLWDFSEDNSAPTPETLTADEQGARGQLATMDLNGVSDDSAVDFDEIPPHGPWLPYFIERAADGGLLVEDLVIETDFSEIPQGWEGVNITGLHQRGLDYGETFAWTEVADNGLNLESRRGLRAENIFPARPIVWKWSQGHAAADI